MPNSIKQPNTWSTIIDELSVHNIKISEQVLKMVSHAPRIFVAGAGRSGLAIQSFAMRLTQLGKKTFIVGGTTTPAFAKDDLLIVATGSGNTNSIKELASTAQRIGGQVWLLTATPQAPLAKNVSVTTPLPGKGKYSDDDNTVQPMGALFEQSVWLYGDAFIMDYMRKYQISEKMMQNNHANLE